jgi:N-acyl-D-aspartate/D-glutamate deacylase
MCHAGFGPHLLGHWVRETGTFTLQEAVRRLTSHPAQLYRIPQRGRIEPGYWADLLLFDPKTIGISEARLVNDFPGDTARLVRDGTGIHSVWVNGQCAFDGKQYNPGGERSGHVLDSFSA